jgi:hypothetical protein
VNAIIPFSIMALFWVVLTVGAAIAAIIDRLFIGGPGAARDGPSEQQAAD